MLRLLAQHCRWSRIGLRDALTQSLVSNSGGAVACHVVLDTAGDALRGFGEESGSMTSENRAPMTHKIFQVCDVVARQVIARHLEKLTIYAFVGYATSSCRKVSVALDSLK